jgi:phosphatidate cytidylyltransferase
MKQRIITGIIAAVLLIALLYEGPFYLLLITATFFALLGFLEFDRLFFTEVSWERRIRGGVLIASAVYTLAVAPFAVSVFFWFPLLWFSVRRVASANEKGNFQSELKDLSTEILGFIYLVCLFGFLVPLAASGGYGREALLLIFILVFCSDVAAYFVGMKWGKHRLATQLSPKKSLEGALGGVFGSIVGGSLWLAFLYSGPTSISFVVAILLFSPIASLLGQLGDLFESMLKRSQAQKDSGFFLPGHGGVLDRVDGLVFAAPVFYFYWFWFLMPLIEN